MTFSLGSFLAGVAVGALGVLVTAVVAIVMGLGDQPEWNEENEVRNSGRP